MGAPTGASRRLLLVCHEYANPGHTGGMRWRALVPALIERGWQVDVIARAPGLHSGIGPDGTHETGATLHLVQGDGWLGRWRQRRQARWLARRRQSAAASPAEPTPVAPDDVPPYRPDVGPRAWLVAVLDALEAHSLNRRVTRCAHELLDRAPADVLLVTSPTHLAHGAGVALADRLPFVAEYRDPLYYGRGRSRDALDPVSRLVWRHAEHRTFERAAHIVDIADGVTGTRRAELRHERPAHRVPPHSVVPSGHGADEPAPGAVDRERFRIAYVGWLWPFMPVPETLAAIGAFRASLNGALGPDDERLSVEFVGSEDDFRGRSLAAIAAGAGLHDRFVARPRVARAEATRVQAAAAVSLLFDSVCEEPVCIPSKLYHSARCHGRLLPIGATDGAMAREAGRIDMPTCAPDDTDAIVRSLHDALSRWHRGELIEPADRDGRFDMHRRADALEPILRAVAATAN